MSQSASSIPKVPANEVSANTLLQSMHLRFVLQRLRCRSRFWKSGCDSYDVIGVVAPQYRGLQHGHWQLANLSQV
jgi:hypothetical protein